MKLPTLFINLLCGAALSVPLIVNAQSSSVSSTAHSVIPISAATSSRAFGVPIRPSSLGTASSQSGGIRPGLGSSASYTSSEHSSSLPSVSSSSVSSRDAIGADVFIDYTQSGALIVRWQASYSMQHHIVVHRTTDPTATINTITSSADYGFIEIVNERATHQVNFTNLTPLTTYYFLVEIRESSSSRVSPLVVGTAQQAAPATGKLNDTGNNHILIADDGHTITFTSTSSAGVFPQQDATTGRDIAHSPKIGSGNAGFDFTYLGHDGAPVTSPDDAECIRDNVTGFVWELKTRRNYRHTYLWKPSRIANYQNRGYIAQINALAGNLDSACGMPLVNCTTEAFINEINASQLCGASDWGLPSATQLESIISLDSQHLLVRLGAHDYVHHQRLFTIDPMFNRERVSHSIYSPLLNLYLASEPYWTSTLNRDSYPVVVDFTSGEVLFRWHTRRPLTLENSRHAVRLVRGGLQ